MARVKPWAARFRATDKGEVATMRAAIAATGLIWALAGCVMPQPPVVSAVAPQARPAAPPAVAAPVAPVRSALSRDIGDYYARVEATMLRQGLLRIDTGGRDTPFNERQLAENFTRIALFEEYDNSGGTIIARQTASRLHRWDRSIRMEVDFGATVDPAQASLDRRAIIAYAARLGQLTGVGVTQVESGGNFNVFVVNEDERRALGPRLRQLIPGISASAVRTVTDLPRSSYCLVFAFDPQSDGTYERAVAVIRAEHPNLLRLSCFHEELAQAMGLSNDSPNARPSIFNDDEEFALLTGHDEMLLRMLYDPRLKPGMTADVATPIVTQIAAEMLGGSS